MDKVRQTKAIGNERVVIFKGIDVNDSGDTCISLFGEQNLIEQPRLRNFAICVRVREPAAPRRSTVPVECRPCGQPTGCAHTACIRLNYDTTPPNQVLRQPK